MFEQLILLPVECY